MSSAVSWWSVHEHVSGFLADVGAWPLAGSPEWCALADDDPAKLAALLDAAQHHALRVEIAQEARAQVSRDVAAAADWKHISRELMRVNEFRAAHPWAKRVAG